MKPVRFMGSAKVDLSAFPDAARSCAGHDLFLVQEGFDPESWKPMPIVGMGAKEIRVHRAEGAFRVIYVATFPSAVYVLHAFQKKTRATSRRDVKLARRRYREALAIEESV